MLHPWSEMPDDFVLEEYLERYRDAIETQPQRYAGRWADACRPLGDSPAEDAGAAEIGNSSARDAGATEIGNSSARDAAAHRTRYREVRLDLGCGKGAFTVGSALAEPDVLFIGIDVDPVAVACAARQAVDSDAHNAVFVPGRDGALADFFAPAELSTIYLNFPTPHPKGREAPLRLTHVDRLMAYRHLLGENGVLRLQTDNWPFFRYTLAQLNTAGYRVVASTEDVRTQRAKSDDVRDAFPPTPETGYERRAVSMGARICALIATPGPVGTSLAATDSSGTSLVGTDFSGTPLAGTPPHPPIGHDVPASLYDYLPDSLDEMGYIPPEMTRGIAAIARNRTHARAHTE